MWEDAERSSFDPTCRGRRAGRPNDAFVAFVVPHSALEATQEELREHEVVWLSLKTHFTSARFTLQQHLWRGHRCTSSPTTDHCVGHSVGISCVHNLETKATEQRVIGESQLLAQGVEPKTVAEHAWAHDDNFWGCLCHLLNVNLDKRDVRSCHWFGVVSVSGARPGSVLQPLGSVGPIAFQWCLRDSDEEPGSARGGTRTQSLWQEWDE